MAKEEPVACSLDANDLGQRLVGIAEVGAEGLIDRRADGSCHLLRFRSGTTTRRRLEAIITAEAACCAFLDLSLSERDGVLVLSIDAPEAAREVADGLAAAFSGEGG